MIVSRNHFDMVVIGSGPAGQNAALEASARGAHVLLVEQEPQVGGACVEDGTIPSKTLHETALTLTAFQRRSGDIYKIIRDPELSITSLMKRLTEVVQAHQETTRRLLKQANVERAWGLAEFVSPHEIAISDIKGRRSQVTTDNIILANSARPRKLPNFAVDHENILDSDSILSMTYLPHSILILGGGVISCEYASTFAALGVKVTLLDEAPLPLGFLDPEIVDFFLMQFQANGGEFRGNSEIVSAAWDEISSVRVTLKTGEVLKADKAFVALGRVANLDTLAVEKAGLEVSGSGLLTVNEFYQTNVPHIYAAGDMVGSQAMASVAMEQGRRAACHALLGITNIEIGLLPMGVYTIPEIATIGLTEQQAVRTVGNPIVARVHFSQVARAHIMASTSGQLKLVADARGDKLLGVQIAGDGATELVHLGQMAILGKMSVDTFANATFNSPTMAEAYRIAALEIIHARQWKTSAPAPDARSVTTLQSTLDGDRLRKML